MSLSRSEAARLTSVAYYRSAFILNSAILTVLTQAAAAILQMPMAWITLLDKHDQHILAASGEILTPDQLDRASSFCTRAIRHPDRPFVVYDTQRDSRFSANALTLGPLAIRSYAGMPLLGREGLPLGTLCVLGVTPRQLQQSDLDTLQHLAAAVTAILEAHRADAERHYSALAPPEPSNASLAPAWYCGADGVVDSIAADLDQSSSLSIRPSVGAEWTALVHSLQQDVVRSQWRQTVAELAPFELDFRTHDRDGVVHWLQVKLIPPASEENTGASNHYWSGFCKAIDQLAPRHITSRNPATDDTLTGLINRDRFQILLDYAVRDAQLGIPLALLYIDLDDFKSVNDILGHEVGDRVLQEVAGRLLQCTRHTDVVCRLGGDEFLVIQIGFTRPADAAQLARRIIDTLSRPMSIDDHVVDIGASVGIALCPRDGTTGILLLRHADLALYRAKQDGRGILRFFDPTMDTLASQQRSLKTDLRHALARGEMHIEYQPIFSLQDNRVVCFEALLRWKHSLRGLVPPHEFIPVAESSGLIVSIGSWVLRQACQAATQWPDDIRVAVNLSPRQFSESNMTNVVSRALADSSLAPGRLELEITETLPLLSSERNLAALRRLRDIGVQTVLDDFGTGYSSLAYLSAFRFDQIKLDRALVASMSHTDGLSIARAIIRLAADLGMTVTAEGIETLQQFRQVTAEGCSKAQGYYIARPMEAHLIPAALHKITTKLQSSLRRQSSARKRLKTITGCGKMVS